MAKKEESTEQLTPQQQKLKALQAAMAKIEKRLRQRCYHAYGRRENRKCRCNPHR